MRAARRNRSSPPAPARARSSQIQGARLLPAIRVVAADVVVVRMQSNRDRTLLEANRNRTKVPALESNRDRVKLQSELVVNSLPRNPPVNPEHKLGQVLANPTTARAISKAAEALRMRIVVTSRAAGILAHKGARVATMVLARSIAAVVYQESNPWTEPLPKPYR